MNAYSPIALNNVLPPNGDIRNRSTPRAESLSFVIRIFIILVGIATVVFVAGITTKRHRELTSLREELQELDKAKREQEKILVNLNMELTRLKDGANITVKARRLGLRPATHRQMRYSTQIAHHYQQPVQRVVSQADTRSRQIP